MIREPHVNDATDLTAPGYSPGAEGLPWRRRAFAQGGGYIVPSAAFLLIPVYFALGHGPVLTALVILNCLVIGVFFLGSTLVMHWPTRGRWLWLAGLAGSISLLGLLGSRPVFFIPFVTCVAVTLIAWRHALLVVIAVTIVGLVAAVMQGDLVAVVMVLTSLTLAVSIGLSFRYGAARAALRKAEERTAVLAVAAERERIARDLHDILGHSLTTIAVKADLAERLVGRDAAAALAQIREVAAVARQSLKDVRATAVGMREVRLAGEIASARSVLVAAGVECRAPVALPVLDDAESELLGYAVREAVTNVVRHAGAATCTIEADAHGVRIIDDGRGMDAAVDGSGVAGLRERVERAGGLLQVVSSTAGTTLAVRLRRKDEGGKPS